MNTAIYLCLKYLNRHKTLHHFMWKLTNLMAARINESPGAFPFFDFGPPEVASAQTAL